MIYIIGKRSNLYKDELKASAASMQAESFKSVYEFIKEVLVDRAE